MNILTHEAQPSSTFSFDSHTSFQTQFNKDNKTMVQTQLYFKEKKWCGFSEFSLSSLGIWPQSYQVNWDSLSSSYQSCSAAIRWELGLGRSPFLLRGFSSLVFMHCFGDYLMQPRECFQGLDNAMRSHLVWFLWFLYDQCRCGPLHSPKTC